MATLRRERRSHVSIRRDYHLVPSHYPWLLARTVAVFISMTMAFHGNGVAVAVDQTAVISEYDQASAKLEAFYSQCTLTALRTEVNRRGAVSKHQLRFVAGNGYFKSSFTVLEFPEKEHIGFEDVALTLKPGGVWLQRLVGTEAFVLARVTPDAQVVKQAMRDLLPAFGSFCFRRDRFIDMMKEPGFRIIRCESIGDSRIKVDWESSADVEGEGRILRKGSFLFDKALSWALLEGTVAVGTPTIPVIHTDRLVMKYAGAADGIPLPSECRFWVEQPGDRDADKRPTIYADISVTPGNSSLKEFDLNYYGVKSLQSGVVDR